jgi:two-component system chemotaxis response regulator CheV
MCRVADKACASGHQGRDVEETSMAGVLDGVNQRTQLVGQNRLELLLFRLGGRQRFGINVFKVQEVIQCPALTRLPNAHPAVRGVANMRGKTIPVVDLGMAIGRPPVKDTAGAYIVIAEFNRSVQGFLVGAVERIVNLNWEAVLPPPKGAEKDSYMTAVTQVDKELVEIIDVEKVLAEVVGTSDMVSARLAENAESMAVAVRHVLVADDSMVARNQVKRALQQVGIETTLARDGREALKILKDWAEEGTPVGERVAMVISDIEMPEMDGYTLTTEIRKDPRLKDLYVLLHSSLSGVFNNAMVQKVGADRFLAKFSADELAGTVLGHIDERAEPQRAQA